MDRFEHRQDVPAEGLEVVSTLLHEHGVEIEAAKSVSDTDEAGMVTCKGSQGPTPGGRRAIDS